MSAAFEFASPFPEWPQAIQIAVFALAPLAGLALCVWLYRRDMRRVRRPFAIALLTLRCLLLAAVFLVLLGDPKLAKTRKETVPGRVLVALDLSESLRITDKDRPAGEKLRIVQALGIAKDIAKDKDFDKWLKVEGRPNFDNPEESDRYQTCLERHDALTRLEIAERLLGSDGANLLDELRKKHNVEIVGFDQTSINLPASQDARRSKIEPGRAPNPASANGTDIKLPLTRAGEIAGDSQSRLVGVVLLTDGRHNWGTSPSAKAKELAGRNVPIFPVVLAPNDAPSDIAIVEAQAQAATVFQGTRVPVDLTVRATRWPAGPITVKLELPSNEAGVKPPPVVETIPHPGGDASYPLSLKAKMDGAGPQTITVSAESTAAKDRFPSNNRRTLRVNVVKDRARVLLIDGEARWEFHYLQTLLGRDEHIDLRSIVFRQPRVTDATDDDLRKIGIPARTLPADPDALNNYDCILLGDVEPDQLNLADRLRLEKYVSENGGTLVMIAGKRAMPKDYAGNENDPLRKLLPISKIEIWNEKLGFRPTPTPEGARSWFLQLAEKRGESQSVWDGLPAHYWAATGEAKPGAEVLADAEGKPLIVRQNYGFGRVLFMGFDSTWRWRYKIGDRLHHRFWGQVVQWAASDRLLPTSNAAGTIRFGTREPAFRAGQPVEIVVRASDGAKKLTPTALKGARILKKPEKPGEIEKVAGLVPLTVLEGRAGELSGSARDLLPGRYSIELDIPEWADQLVGVPRLDRPGTKLRSDFEVLPGDGEELLELSANRPLLEELATVTGGEVFTPDRAKELMEKILSQSATVEHRTEYPLRTSWWTLALVLLLLSMEWGIRKWAGLP